MAANLGPGDLGHLELLAAVAHAVAASRDLEGALTGVLETAAPALGGSAAAVYLVDPDRIELHLAAAVGVSGDDMTALAVTELDSNDPAARAGREARTVDLAATDVSGSGHDLAARVGFVAGRYVPLQVGRDGVEATVGVFAIGWPATHRPSDTETLVIAAVADTLAAAIDRGRLAATIAERAEWLERLAHTDPLTGLANRRTLDRVLELELARAGRQAGEVSVALFDVDNLGEVNREAGHSVGDDMLRAVASVLADSVRLVDTVARFGGDEFVVVAPGSGGMAVATRVLEGIARHPSVGGRPLTVSAGIARFPADGASAAELVDAAEAALALARDSGAGRIAGPSGVTDRA